LKPCRDQLVCKQRDGLQMASTSQLFAEQHELLLFDMTKQSWAKLADSIVGDDLNWSHDSRYLYSNRSIGNKPQIVRVALRGGNAENVANLESLSKLTGMLGDGLCIAPDKSIIVTREINSSEIYALDWKTR
jgi:hypothetical protein